MKKIYCLFLAMFFMLQFASAQTTAYKIHATQYVNTAHTRLYIELSCIRLNNWVSTDTLFQNATIRLQFGATSGVDFTSTITDESSGWTDIPTYGSATISAWLYAYSKYGFTINFPGAPVHQTGCIAWPSNNIVKICKVSVGISDDTKNSEMDWYIGSGNPAGRAANSGYCITSSDIPVGNDHRYSVPVDWDANPVTPLPVEIVSLTASLQSAEVKLIWQTATEMNNYGFDVERSTVNSDWQKIGFVQGAGASNIPQMYTFNDALTTKLSHEKEILYRLKQIDRDGTITYSGVARVVPGAVAATPVLYAGYPNPFHGVLTVQFSVPSTTPVSITLSDVAGRVVGRVYENQSVTDGYYSLLFDANALPCGIYLLRMVAGSYSATQNLVLTK